MLMYDNYQEEKNDCYFCIYDGTTTEFWNSLLNYNNGTMSLINNSIIELNKTKMNGEIGSDDYVLVNGLTVMNSTANYDTALIDISTQNFSIFWKY